MGIVPLQYLDGESTDSLKLTGKETFTINLPASLKPGMNLPVSVSYFKYYVIKFL